MYRGEELVAITRGVVVWFDYRSNTTLPLPADVRAKVRSTSAIPPDES